VTRLDAKTDIDNLNRGVGELKEIFKKISVKNCIRIRVQTNESIQFAQSAKIIADVTQHLTKLDETNRRVVDVADELKTLQMFCKTKTAQCSREYYLISS
jgi:DNA recombination protein RmuC